MSECRLGSAQESTSVGDGHNGEIETEPIQDHRTVARDSDAGAHGRLRRRRERFIGYWILGIEEVTQLAREIQNAVKNKSKQLPEVPEEKVYQVNDEIQKSLGISN
ncbi:MAG: hypothetical protein SWZ49_08415 [Cyanobacteriota bacterium]|nr:hypothetical protein [Cyanobacteriota bacterium]